MNLSLGQKWDYFLNELVHSGRYISASEAVRDGLRLLENFEQKRLALKSVLDDAIANGGSHTDQQIEAYLDEALDAWQKQQKPA